VIARVAAAVALTATVALQGTPGPRPIERLGWLAGCWQAASPRRVAQETWTAPRGGVMFSVARTFRGDSLVEYELVVLRQRGDSLVYQAHPSGQPAAAFTAPPASISDTMVVFENAAHDYPQRIGYRKIGADSLLAWIDGTTRGRPRRVDYPFARGCDGR
jgi:hypothetical protein